jgi:hypothetical protein
MGSPCEICGKEAKYRNNSYGVQQYAGYDGEKGVMEEGKVLHWLCEEHFRESGIKDLDEIPRRS